MLRSLANGNVPLIAVSDMRGRDESLPPLLTVEGAGRKKTLKGAAVPAAMGKADIAAASVAVDVIVDIDAIQRSVGDGSDESDARVDSETAEQVARPLGPVIFNALMDGKPIVIFSRASAAVHLRCEVDDPPASSYHMCRRSLLRPLAVAVGSAGTSQAEVSRGLPAALLSAVKAHAAEAGVGVTLEMSCGIAAEKSVDTLAGGIEAANVHFLTPDGLLGCTPELSPAPVADASEAQAHVDNMHAALESDAHDSGLAIVIFRFTLTDADSIVTKAKLVVLSEGNGCTAVCEAVRWSASGKLTMRDTLATRVAFTHLHDDYPVCVGIVHFGPSSSLVRQQLILADAARNFRRNEVTPLAMVTTRDSTIRALKAQVAEFERSVAAGRGKLEAQGSGGPASHAVAAASSAAVRAYPTYPHVSALDEPFPHAAAHRP